MRAVQKNIMRALWLPYPVRAVPIPSLIKALKTSSALQLIELFANLKEWKFQLKIVKTEVIFNGFLYI